MFSCALNGRHDAGTNLLSFKPGSEPTFGAMEKHVVLIIDDGNPTRHTYGLGPLRFLDISHATSHSSLSLLGILCLRFLS